MAIEAQPTTVHLAFPQSKQYAIPSYQRNYVWTREGQWEPLWEDLLALLPETLSAGPGKRPHFLGTMITKDIGTRGFITRWSVVDGQQRLTTIQILIAACCSVFKELALRQPLSILRKYLANSDDVVERTSDRYKINHKSRDYRGFSAVIEAGLGGSQPPHGSNLPLHACYTFFRNTIMDWAERLPERAQKDHARALAQAILYGLQVVDIRLDGTQNSHAIFEALNARGEPLTEWEKTKNYILSVAVREADPDGDETYKKYLETYDDDPYWSEIVSGARFSGKRIDLFLSFFAQIELPKRRREALNDRNPRPFPRGRLYREFRMVGERVYRRSDDALDRLLERFGRYAEIYRRLDQRDSGLFTNYARLVMHRRGDAQAGVTDSSLHGAS